MIRHIILLRLKIRAWWLEVQIENGEELLADHGSRLRNCYEEMRKIQSRIVTLETPANLLVEAMRRK